MTWLERVFQLDHVFFSIDNRVVKTSMQRQYCSC